MSALQPKKMLVGLLAAVLAFAPISSEAASYQYFRMYGGGAFLGGGPVAPPASILTYTVSGLGIGTVGQSYAATSSVVGATGAVVFSLSSGALPTGLSLNPSTGSVSGIAAVAGSFNAILKATDSTGAIGLGAFHVKISPVFSVSGNPGLVGTTGVPYSAAFSGVGGSAPYSFSTASSLPTGLSLSAGGLLSGTPSISGAFAGISIVGLDHDGRGSTFAPFNLTIYDPVQVSWAPPAGTAGTFYTTAPSASGGHTPYNFTLTGIAPAGLSFNAANGTLSGTPTNSGDFTLSIVAHDYDSRSATTGPTTVTIAPGVTPPATLTISGTPGAGQVDVGYLATFTSTGGSGGNVYTLAAGSLPAGLSLSSSGVISGTPSVAGTTSGLKVRVTDSASATALSGAFSITIAPQPVLQISGSPATTARVGDAYTTTFNGTDGAGYGYTFSSVGSALPPGLSLADANGTSGIISGTPTHIGTYGGLKIRVTDGQGHTADSGTFSISVAVISGPALTVSGSPASSADVGSAFNAVYSATGGTGAGYLFDVSAGALPTGLTLSTSGSLSGTLTAAGSYSFTVRVVDSSGDSATKSSVVSVATPIDLNTPALADATWGSAYSYSLFATGGRTPYTFTHSGSFPNGISLNSTSGEISGTPIGSGIQTFPVSITATDADGRVVAKNASLTVYPATTFSAYSPPSGTVGESYSYSFAGAQGGSGQFTYQILLNGTLTASTAISDLGLTFDPSNGSITGTPTSSGTTPALDIRAMDTVRGSIFDRGPFTLTIAGVVQISGTPSSAAQVGTPYSATFSGSAGSGTGYVFSSVGSPLPTGLSVASSTGILSGTPSHVGTYSGLKIRVTDSAGQTADSSVFSITVAAGSGAALAISGTPTSQGEIGTAYSSAPFTISGGSGGYSYALGTGALPAGLTIDSAGLISGTPTTAQISTFTVVVSDSVGSSASTPALAITIASAQTAPTGTLAASGFVGTAYSSGPLTTHGGTGPFTWSLGSGALPDGFTLDPSSGIVSGTATLTGSYDFTLAATDSLGAVSANSATQTIVLVLPNMGIALTSGAIVRKNTTITGTLTSSRTNPVWTFTQSSPASPVLSLTASGNTAPATFSGTAPDVLSSTDFTFFATGTNGGSSTPTPSLTVTVKPTFAVSGGPSSDVTGSQGSAITPTPAVTYDSSNIAVNPSLALIKAGSPVTLSSLCPGLSFSTSTGVISGTPSATCSQSGLTIRATDSDAATASTGSFSIAIAIAQTAPTGALTSSGIDGVSFNSGSLSPNGSVGPYTWSMTPVSGSITLGLSFSSTTGAISGMPGDSGTFSFTLNSIDAFGVSSPASATQTITITRTPSTQGFYASTAQVGTPYSSASPGVTGGPGTPPYTYAVYEANTLPPGLSVDLNSGAITGTPTTAGTYVFSVFLFDANGITSQNTGTTQTITVSGATATATPSASTYRSGGAISGSLASSLTSPLWSFSQTPSSPSLGLTGSGSSFSGTAPSVASSTNYSSIVATATTGATSVGAAPFTLTIAPVLALTGGPVADINGTGGIAITSTPAASAGATRVGTVGYALIQSGSPVTLSSLCPGLSFSTSTGVISGTPSANCSLSGLLIRGTDSFDNATALTATAFSITIANIPTAPTGTLTASGFLGSAYSSGPLTTHGGSAPFTWSIGSGALPDGIALNSSTGVVSGTSTVLGTFTFTLAATDKFGAVSPNSATQTIVLAAPTIGIALTSAATTRVNSTITGTLSTSRTAPAWTFTQSTPASPVISFTPSGSTSSATFSGTAPNVSSTTAFTFFATASNDSTRNDTSSVTVTVKPALSLTGGAASVTGNANVAITPTPAPTVSNAIGTLSYALRKAGAPYTTLGTDCPGLSISSSTGVISGTSTSPCAQSGLSTRATDSYDSTSVDTASFSITINGAATSALTSGAAVHSGQPITGTMSTTIGGSPVWSFVTSPSSPALALTSSGNTTSATFFGTAPTVTDITAYTASLTATNGALMATAADLSISIRHPFFIGSGPSGTNVGTIGTAFSTLSFSQNYKIGTSTFGLYQAGSPVTNLSTQCPGLSLSTSTGVISGTPTGSCYLTGLTIQANDSADVNPAASTSSSFDISIASAISIVGTPSAAAQGSTYSFDLSTLVSGGRAPFTFTITTGSLPTGMSLSNSNGHTGNAVTATVVTGTSSTPSFQITDVDGRSFGPSTVGFSVTAATASAALTSATVRQGASVGGTLTSNLTTPTWSFVNTPTPTGPVLTLTPSGATSSATFSGTAPSVSQSTSFSIVPTATLANGFAKAGAAVALTVKPAFAVSGGASSFTGGTGVAITPTTALSYGTTAVGTPSVVLRQAGSTVSIGTLCPGLSLASGTGVISGTPSAACSVTGLTLLATDSDGATGSSSTFTVTITTSPAISGTAASGTQGQAYSYSLTSLTTGGTSPYTYSVSSGAVPAGLSLASNGLVSGTPTGAGTVTPTIQVTDSIGRSVPGVVSFTITGQVSNVSAIGAGTSGQLGDGNSTSSTVRVGALGTKTYTQISAGGNTSCAVASDGTLDCWGANGGSFGNGLTARSSSPLNIAGLTGVTWVSTNGATTCIVISGAVQCTGYNGNGELGNGSKISSNSFVTVTGLTSGYASVYANPGSGFACAINTSGGVKCWGYNGYGNLGDNTTTEKLVPTQVSGLTSGVTALALGGAHACAVVSGGVKCWGSGNALGNGSAASKSIPTQVTGIPASSGATTLGAGYNASCATVNGGVQCWGDNAYGEVGNNSTTATLVPIQVTGLPAGSGASVVTIGANSACGIISGTIKCWGNNANGQLGDGSKTQRLTPVVASQMATGQSAISLGDNHLLTR